MATRQNVLLQEDFSYGIDTDSAPHRIDPRGLADLHNGLYEEDGSVYGRGGSQGKSAAAAAALTWTYDAYFDVGQRTVAATAADFLVLAADDTALTILGSDGLTVPPGCAFLESMLFIGGGYIYGGSRKTASYSTGVVAVTAAAFDASGNITNETAAKTVTKAAGGFTANADAGMLFQIGNERAYVVASVDSDTQITLRDPYAGSTSASTAFALHNIYKITAADPYKDSAFYGTCANRLLAATANVVEFSEVKAPHSFSITIDGEVIPNEHELPEGSRVTAYGTIGQTAVVGTTHGLWTIDGLAFDVVDASGNPQHKVQVLSREHVTYGGISTWEQTLIVPCVSGVFRIDGISTPRRISHPIETYYHGLIESGYRAGQSAVYRDHFLLPIINSTAEVQIVLVARMDRTIQVSNQVAHPWSLADGDGVECPAFTVRTADTPADPILLAANGPVKKIVDCSGFFEPSGANKLDADGLAPVWDLTTRDYPTGNGTLNMVRHLRIRRELADDDADNPEIDILYATGAVDPDLPYWGHPDGEWGTGFGPSGTDPWTDSTDANFHSVCTAPEDPDGTAPHKCRVNVPTRFIRYRLRCDEPRASLRLRSLETFVRPSKAVRR